RGRGDVGRYRGVQVVLGDRGAHRDVGHLLAADDGASAAGVGGDRRGVLGGDRHPATGDRRLVADAGVDRGADVVERGRATDGERLGERATDRDRGDLLVGAPGQLQAARVHGGTGAGDRGGNPVVDGVDRNGGAAKARGACGG